MSVGLVARFVVKDDHDAGHDAKDQVHYNKRKQRESDKLVNAVDFVHASILPDPLLLAANLLCFSSRSERGCANRLASIYLGRFDRYGLVFVVIKALATGERVGASVGCWLEAVPVFGAVNSAALVVELNVVPLFGCVCSDCANVFLRKPIVVRLQLLEQSRHLNCAVIESRRSVCEHSVTKQNV